MGQRTYPYRSKGQPRTRASEAAQAAWDTVIALERDYTESLRLLVPNPQAYAERVCQIDDSTLPAAQHEDSIRDLVGPHAWPTLLTMSQALNETPGEASICLARWKRLGVVYAVDPTTSSAILDTDWGTTPIPGEVLQHLPHPDPVVVLPTPIRLPRNDGYLEEYQAFGVFGVRKGMLRCSTHDPRAESLCLYFFAHVIDPQTHRPFRTLAPSYAGELRNVAHTLGLRVVTPMQDYTMHERETLAAEEMLRAGPLATDGFPSISVAQDSIAHLTRVGLSLLVYVAAGNADVQRVKLTSVSRRTRGNQKSAPPPGEVLAAGFRVGADLRQAAGRNEPDTTPAGDPTGRTVQPHVRRAHLHTFRVGPGRTQRVVHWLAPTVVGGKPKAGQVHLI